MFRDLPWRSALNDLVLRGGLSLIVCALAALCVCGGLSALAANSKERSNYGDQAGPCKAGNCVAKAKGSEHRVANTKSEKRASQF
jgi:hypothetical protein